MLVPLRRQRSAILVPLRRQSQLDMRHNVTCLMQGTCGAAARLGVRVAVAGAWQRGMRAGRQGPNRAGCPHGGCGHQGM
jgi:hypothetical protein